MIDLSRRRLLQAGAVAGVAGTLPNGIGTAVAESSPALEKYVQPVPIPEVREPDGKRKGADYYEIPVVEFEKRLHPDLPETTLWGFDGSYPGPIIRTRRNERIKVRFDNSDLPEEHLLDIDDRINGTDPADYPDYDGPVPDVRTVTHFHGLNVAPEDDGQADMWKSPDGVTGPRFSKHVHDIPNRQRRLTSTYHDHARGISRLNVYAGLAGFCFITSEQEAQLDLPTGEYDVPLMLQDRSFEEDGSLHYPDSFVPNVAGDTAVVNGAVWPYLEVEPRRYRLRLLNVSNGQAFDIRLENESGSDVPTLYQIAAGHGFLDRVVEVGPDGDLDSLLLAPFERGDVVVDFSGYAGETFTVTTDAEFPIEGGDDHDEGGDHQAVESSDGDDHDDGHDGGGHGGGNVVGGPLDELMQIRVTDSPTTDDSADPRELVLPSNSGPDENAAVETRHMSMSMDMKMDSAEPPIHLLNDRRFNDDIAVQPQLGTTEIWELENGTMHTHPIHLHLVEFDVIGRGPDGTDDPDPNERVGKDTVRVNPDETVRILVKFGDFAGQYPFHCHILEHEDHEMMRPFEVVKGNSGGKGRGNGR